MFQSIQPANKATKNTDSNSPRQQNNDFNMSEMLHGHDLVGAMNSQPAQMMVKEEEEPRQGKAIQKQEEDELQMKEASESTSASSAQSGSKTSLPKDVNSKMENSFGTSFSDVNIHKNDDSATKMGALAYTQGNNVHFAPGQYNPNTSAGQELLGHELTHVVQQRQGRVQPTKKQGKGFAVNDSPALENEADDMGKKAAAGKDASGITNSTSTGAPQLMRSLPGGITIDQVDVQPDDVVDHVQNIAIQADGQGAGGGLNVGRWFNADMLIGGAVSGMVNSNTLERIDIDYIERENLNMHWKGWVKFKVDNIVEKEVHNNQARNISRSGTSQTSNSLANANTNSEKISAEGEYKGVKVGGELAHSNTRTRTQGSVYSNSNSSSESINGNTALYEADVFADVWLDVDPAFEGGFDIINPVKWAGALTSLGTFEAKGVKNVGKIYYYGPKH